MRRREFIAGLGGTAVWPLVARAQQGERMRRIGVLMPFDENDPFAKLQLSTLTQALADLGWTDGRNVRMDLRWAGGDINRIRAFAQELVGLQPDIIVAGGTPVTAAVQQETRTIPIVFVTVGDPVASGLVAALNQPGGNITGYALYETPWEASGLNCSRRSRPASSGPRSCSIPTPLPCRLICPHLIRRPGHSRSCQSLRLFIAT
jgi:putative tryptophan/tyrosine transport system substrate-binding protein